MWILPWVVTLTLLQLLSLAPYSFSSALTHLSMLTMETLTPFSCTHLLSFLLHPLTSPAVMKASLTMETTSATVYSGLGSNRLRKPTCERTLRVG